MLSRSAQAALNVEQARDLRNEGRSYREIRRRLGLTANQLAHVRRVLKREKAARTRLTKAQPGATARDLPVLQSALPTGLREILYASGYRTLGAVADGLAAPEQHELEAIPGVGPHRAHLIRALLDRFDLLPGPADLQAEIERLFPELKNRG
jgi:hypothetical protein